MPKTTATKKLWLDVEKGRDTTSRMQPSAIPKLWLDVEKGRDTTKLGL